MTAVRAAWTERELHLKEKVESGRSVLANESTDKALVAWAQSEGRYRYIGRPTRRHKGSRWANPYRIPQDGDRKQVIALFVEMLRRDRDWLEGIEDLGGGKVLACWCALEDCHGDVLLEKLSERRPS